MAQSVGWLVPINSHRHSPPPRTGLTRFDDFDSIEQSI